MKMNSKNDKKKYIKAKPLIVVIGKDWIREREMKGLDVPSLMITFPSCTLQSKETFKLVQQFNLETGIWKYYSWIEIVDEKGRMKDRSLKIEL